MNIYRAIYLFLSVLLISVALGNVDIRVSYSEALDGDDPETTELVVKLALDTGVTIADVNQKYGTTTRQEMLHSAGIFLLHVPDHTEARDLASQMRNDPKLVYVEPNFEGETPEGDGRRSSEWGGQDPAPQTSQYAASIIGLDTAHSFRRGAGTVVAVLDTGLQMDHPAFSSVLTTARYDFIDDDDNPEDVGNGQDDDGDGHIDEALGHGTHVAGIIHFVAPEAQIMPLRVLDADGRGNMFVIAEALLYAAENGANVINLSLGSSQESELMEDIIEDLVEDHQIVIVSAAGNLNSDAEQFPASEEEVLGVTSIGANSQKSDFASYGDWVDVAAPGESIYSTFPTSGYAWWSGTSMSTPFVAGQAALIYSAVPAMPAPFITTYIRDSAHPIDNVNPGYEEMLGNGRIDIGGSLQTLCTPNGGCQMPEQGGRVTLSARAIVQSRPDDGLRGVWVIGDQSYVANAETEFRQDHGDLKVGGCVSVEYRNTSPLTARTIRSRDSSECTASANTPTPTATSSAPATSTPTPTLVSSRTPTGTTTLPPTPTVTVSTPSATATRTATPTATVTASVTPPPPGSGQTSRSVYLPFVMR